MTKNIMSDTPSQSNTKRTSSPDTARNRVLTREPSPKKITRQALKLRAELAPRKPVGRPPKLTPELADEIFEAVANGGSIKHALANHDISATAFYHGLANNPEFKERYEEAVFIRYRMFGETLISLSIEAGSGLVDVRDVMAEAHLLEKGMAHINGGANSWKNRRRAAEPKTNQHDANT